MTHYGAGYGYGYGHGDGYGDGAGDGHGYSYGDGHGYGYGDCDGYGFADCTGDCAGPWPVSREGDAIRVGCVAMDADAWRRRWRAVAREHGVPAWVAAMLRAEVLG
jgi:hypothetical protein